MGSVLLDSTGVKRRLFGGRGRCAGGGRDTVDSRSPPPPPFEKNPCSILLIVCSLSVTRWANLVQEVAKDAAGSLSPRAVHVVFTRGPRLVVSTRHGVGGASSANKVQV